MTLSLTTPPPEKRTKIDPARCADREWMARALLNTFVGAGWTAEQTSELAAALKIEALIAIQDRLRGTERLVPRHTPNQETAHGEAAQG